MRTQATCIAEMVWGTEVRHATDRQAACDPIAAALRDGPEQTARAVLSIEEVRKRGDEVRIPIARAYYAAVERPEMRPSWYTRATRLRAVIEATCGSNDSFVREIRAAAMIAFYGPASLHDEWLWPVGPTDRDRCLAGTPSDAAFEQLPMLREAVEQAERRLLLLLGVYESCGWWAP